MSPLVITIREFEGTIYALPGWSIDLSSHNKVETTLFALPSPSSVSANVFFLVVGFSLLLVYYILVTTRYFVGQTNSISKTLYINSKNIMYGYYNEQKVTIISIPNDHVVQQNDDITQCKQNVPRYALLVHIVSGITETKFVYNNIMEPIDFSSIDFLEFIRTCLNWIYKLCGADLVYKEINLNMFWIHKKRKKTFEIMGIDWACEKSSNIKNKKQSILMMITFLKDLLNYYQIPFDWRISELIDFIENTWDEKKIQIESYLRHYSFWEPDHILRIICRTSNHFQNRQLTNNKMRNKLEEEKMKNSWC